MGLRNTGSLSRTAIVLFACGVAWVTGVRTPRAAAFDDVVFAGKGRTTLVIEERGAGIDPEIAQHFEVFATMVFGTEISAFEKGIYARSTFTLPRTGERAVLVVDVDRRGGTKNWRAGDKGLRARMYSVAGGGSERFDADAVSGSIALEGAVVGRREAGFRIRGWLEMVDAGPDGVRDSDDDRAFELDVTLESVPSPEEIDGQPAPAPRRPQSGLCELPWCWSDDGYYDAYGYGYGCSDADVGYETTSGGCADEVGPVVDDGYVDPLIDDDGSTAQPGVGDGYTDQTSSDGCASNTDGSGYDGSGCEGSDDGGASDGCDGGDSGDSASGCADSGGSSSGCGSSGCEGDTLESQGGGAEVVTRSQQAGVDLVGLLLFSGAIGAWVAGPRRRRERRPLKDEGRRGR